MGTMENGIGDVEIWLDDGGTPLALAIVWTFATADRPWSRWNLLQMARWEFWARLTGNHGLEDSGKQYDLAGVDMSAKQPMYWRLESQPAETHPLVVDTLPVSTDRPRQTRLSFTPKTKLT